MDPTPTIKELLSSFLQAIPDHDKDEEEIGEIIIRLKIKDQEIILQYLEAVFHVLKIFSAVEYKEDSPFLKSTIKANSILSKYFLHSLAEYIYNDLSILLEPITPNSRHPFINPDFLYNMERYRVSKVSNPKPIRHVDVAQFIIKTKLKGKKEDYFLMQFDK